MAFYFPVSRLWELGAGAVIALAGERMKFPARCHGLVAAVGAALVLGPIVILNKSFQFPGVNAVYSVLGTALIIWTSAQGSTLVGRVLSMPIFVWFGLISYSLYLWHWPFLVFARMYGGGELVPLAAAIAVMISIPVAYINWKWIEQPFRRRTIPLAQCGPLVTAGIAIVSLSGLGVAVGIWSLELSRLDHNDEQFIRTAEYLAPERSHCVSDYPETEIAQGCVFGKGPLVALWGDSHADHFVPAIHAAAEHLGLRVHPLIKSSCPPILGARVFLSESDEFHECVIFNNNVMRFLEEQDRPFVVIMSGYWASYFANGRRGGSGINALRSVFLSGNADPGSAINLKLMANTLERISASGGKVIVIGASPRFNLRPAQCILRAHLFGYPNSFCTSLDGDASETTERLAGLIERARPSSLELSLIYPTEILCRPDCSPVDEDKNGLYRDQHHLSDAGSLLLLPEFERHLAAMSLNQAVSQAHK